MPLSCAKAFRPTIALLYCTGNEVTAATSFEARVSMVASTPVQNGNTSLRTRIAITTSSSEALPARSPMPLMVHSIWRAPALTPASEFATAMPRSSWQCTEKRARSEFGTRSRSRLEQREIFLRHGVADGVGNIDGGGAGLDRGFDAAAEEIEFGAGAVLGSTIRRRRCNCARASPARSPSRRLRAAPSAACISCAPARWTGRCGCAGARPA